MDVDVDVERGGIAVMGMGEYTEDEEEDDGEVRGDIGVIRRSEGIRRERYNTVDGGEDDDVEDDGERCVRRGCTARSECGIGESNDRRRR